MTWQTGAYFGTVLVAILLTAFLARQAWKQRGLAGSRYYFWLAAAMCVMAMGEALSMLSPNQAMALFWFKTRFLPFAVIPPLWLLFVLEYSGRRNWISKGLVGGLSVIPLVTQGMVWTNSLQGLWVRHEVVFQKSGLFWVADVTQRLPGFWYLVHTLSSLALMLAGSVLLLRTTWHNTHLYRQQAVYLTASALVPVLSAVVTTFNLLPKGSFNPTVPALAMAATLAAAAIFRFDFLKKTPDARESAERIDAREKRSLAAFLLIFLFLAAGIAAFAIISYQNYQQNFRRQVESQLQSIADLKVSGLTNWRNERLADAVTMQHNPAFAGLVQNYFDNPVDLKSAYDLQTWLDSFRAGYKYERVFILDTGGNELISSPATPEMVSSDLTSQEQAVLNGGQVSFLDLHRDTPNGPIHLALMAPIYSDKSQTRPLGILVLRMVPEEFLYPYLSEWPAPSTTAETLLVRRDGQTVLFLNPLRFLPQAALTLRIPLTETDVLAVKAVVGHNGIVEGTDYRGQAVIGAIARIPDSPWFLVARMDLAEANAPLKERLWQTILFFSVLILVAGAGLALLWRQQSLRFYRERFESAEALRASEESYRSLFANMLNGFAYCKMLFDGERPLDFIYLNVNHAFETSTGLKDVVGKRVSEVIPGLRESDAQLFEIYGRVALTGQPETFETYVEALKMWFHISVYSPCKEYFVAVFDVITERKQAEAALDRERTELARSNAELEQFAYVASHDLQEPLRMVSSYVQLLERRYKGRLDKDADEFIGFAVDGAERMQRLINDLLLYSRVGRRGLPFAPTSSEAALVQALENLQVAIKENKAIVTHDPLPEVVADGIQLVQLFQNLVGNAIKFHSKKTPRVHISAGSTSDSTSPGALPAASGEACTRAEWVFSVRDNGIGIDPQFADRIFIIFQRLNSRRQYAGTGIGLSICRKIVLRHGGRIWVESNLGKGATFFFTLPK